MFSHFSSNAVLTKARAKFGTMLNQNDYHNLINCSSVFEIASYLKNNTFYKAVLKNFNETNIHRGLLEMQIKKKFFSDFDILCRYEVTTGEHFYEYVISKSIIQQIIHSIIYLISNKQGTPLLFSSKFIHKYMHLNFEALSSIKNYDDLLKVFKNTGYFKILYGFRQNNIETINLTCLENTLYKNLFLKVLNIIQKYTHGKTKKILNDLFKSIIDIQNYTSIIRMKYSYKSDSAFIENLVMPFGNMTQKQVKSIILSDSITEAKKQMQNTKTGKAIPEEHYSNLDKILKRFIQNISIHYIRFSIHPAVVMLCFMFLSEIEQENIITIIEGIRYHISPKEISKLLVYNRVH